jgi:hypothetical protein
MPIAAGEWARTYSIVLSIECCGSELEEVLQYRESMKAVFVSGEAF